MGNRLTKITTRTGDAGTSKLADGEVLPKSDVVFHALGAVDELNSAIGHALALLPPAGSDDDGLAEIRACLAQVQSRLFDLGGGLAMPNAGVSLADEVNVLDRQASEANAALPPLKDFILPGGCPAGAAMHVARATCRRAERELWAVLAARPGTYDNSLAVYLNRLGDALFIFARCINRVADVPEALWQPLPRNS